jgi:NADPH-dependent 2,4-dienoyl-CoA reductase/sulfur reductase-like enzyme
MPLGTTLHKQGRVAGENAVRGNAQFAGSLGTQVVKVFELAIARSGLGKKRLEQKPVEMSNISVQYLFLRPFCTATVVIDDE